MPERGVFWNQGSPGKDDLPLRLLVFSVPSLTSCVNPTASLHLSALGANQLQSGVFGCPFQEASLAHPTFLTKAFICPDVCKGEDSKRSLLHYLQQTFPFVWQMLPTPPTVQLRHREDVNIYGAGRYGLQCGHGKGTKTVVVPGQAL